MRPYRLKASLVAQMVKNLPAMQGTRVQSLGQEDPLKKGMAAHPSILVLVKCYLRSHCSAYLQCCANPDYPTCHTINQTKIAVSYVN